MKASPTCRPRASRSTARPGVGYLLRPGFQLPPLMFTLAEIEALIVGARMVEAWAAKSLATVAAEALVKIGAVVPPRSHAYR
jgi:predicted DNA-binding transcriptional regulator YafY